MTAKIAEGNARLRAGTCSDTKIVKDECQFSCSFDNGYTVLWAWSVTLKSQGTLNPYYPTSKVSDTTTTNNPKNSENLSGPLMFYWLMLMALF